MRALSEAFTAEQSICACTSCWSIQVPQEAARRSHSRFSSVSVSRWKLITVQPIKMPKAVRIISA